LTQNGVSLNAMRVNGMRLNAFTATSGMSVIAIELPVK